MTALGFDAYCSIRHQFRCMDKNLQPSGNMRVITRLVYIDVLSER